MTLVRWSPLQGFATLQEQMNRLLTENLARGSDEMECGGWLPAVDLREEDHQYVIDVELPGIKKEDIEVHMENNLLTIRGERHFREEAKREGYHRVERAYGKFARSFSLPTRVNPEGISASYKDGILEVLVPKAEESKPKRIDIKG